ncbi:MAG: tRNA uridine-5-carboxymethylaminomethyl(34) synthesis GTPase MnmE [Muribaculaceae bacterium]|nr:tRNA uridine-5-carboxymethylaminomethyl(34) synthesis GTPase MnmE [Muribaculaceae bacterium]
MTIHGGDDTICAISTAPGIGGIAVARVSGPQAIEIADSLWQGRSLATVESHTAHLGNILDSRGELLDQAVATVYRAPRSFTGEDVVEISVHGSRWIQRELINSLCKAGCRLSEPGEFTRRAFSSGRIDLAEAEGIADMIASTSRAAHRAASVQMRGHFSEHLNEMRQKLIDLASLMELELDFSEEEVEFASRQQLTDIATSLLASLEKLHASFATGAAIKDGIPVAILGPTNAGKSSLLNALLQDDRAIVSDIHGTTRDVIDDVIEMGDYLFRLKDTAGLRQTSDKIEQIGIQRSLQAAETARLILFLIDLSAPEEAIKLLRQHTPALPQDSSLIVLLNKADLVDDNSISENLSLIKEICHNAIALDISTTRERDIERVRHAMIAEIDRSAEAAGDILITNARHAQALSNAADSVRRVLDGLQAGISGDFIAQDIRETIHHLSAITGAITTPDLLSTIFTRFCIGK